jgi:hypothetical protein
LADFLASFSFAHFLSSELCSHWLKEKNAASVWLDKYFSVNYCDFLMPTDAVTQNIWPLRTNPTGWDGVKKYYSC